MDRIEWDDALSVGVPKLDSQHKQLVCIFNKMTEERDPSVRSEVVSDILGELTRYAAVHFDSEEVLMRRYGFPGYEEHKQEHMSFTKKVAHLCVDASAHNPDLPESILSFLKNWLVDHLLYCDMKYAAFFGELDVAERHAGLGS
jgi:hemerythrin